MKSRLLVAAVGVPLVFVLLVLLPPWGTALLAALVSCLAAHEMLAAAGLAQPFPTALGCLSALAVTAAAYFRLPLVWLAAWAALMILLLFALWVAYYEKERPFGLAGLGAGLLACLLIPAGMAALILLRQGERGSCAVLLPIVVTFVGDAGALFTGMALGRHKLAPRTSPKKTVEGAVSGVIGSAVLSGIFAAFFYKGHVMHCVLLGVIASAIAQMGDLTASSFKRKMGIKDYGTLIPGHGGIMDRFDSAIFTAPFIYYLGKIIIGLV